MYFVHQHAILNYLWNFFLAKMVILAKHQSTCSKFFQGGMDRQTHRTGWKHKAFGFLCWRHTNLVVLKKSLWPILASLCQWRTVSPVFCHIRTPEGCPLQWQAVFPGILVGHQLPLCQVYLALWGLVTWCGHRHDQGLLPCVLVGAETPDAAVPGSTLHARVVGRKCGLVSRNLQLAHIAISPTALHAKFTDNSIWDGQKDIWLLLEQLLLKNTQWGCHFSPPSAKFPVHRLLSIE